MTTADSGPGSLRDAITQIDADTSHTLYASPSNPSVDEIDFAITAASDTGGGFNAPTGVATLAPQAALPLITNAVVINGYTQPGASANGLALGTNAVLKVQLNGAGAGAGVNSLTISCPDVTVQGLNVVSFSGVGIDLMGAGGDTILGNYVGPDITGSHPQTPAGLVSLWLGDGNTRDAVGANDGTAVGYQPGDTAFVPGESGQAFNFDGTDDSITVPNGPSLAITGSVSLDAWVNVSAFNPFQSWIAGKTSKGGNYQLLLTPDGRAAFFIFDAGTLSYVGAFSSTHLAPGVFYHLAGTYDQATGLLSIYVNGVLDGTASVAPGTVDESNNNFTAFQIGGLEGFGYPGNPQLFTGKIDDVSVYNRALARSEILTIANFKGAAAQGNGTGIVSSSPNNTIGGTSPAARNLLSGNSGDGILVGSSGNLIQGNDIGTDASGLNALGNGANGIEIQAANNLIGGTVSGAGNVLSGSKFGGAAVVLPGAAGVSILGNSIYNNPGGGIDLRSGANDNQVPPLLTSAGSSDNGTTISGTLASVPNTAFRLEFFSNPALAPSGYGQGQTYLGFATVTTDSSGNATFTATGLAALPAGQVVLAATATNLSTNDTSGFSRDGVLTVAGLASSANPSLVGQPVTFTATLSATGFGTPTGRVDFVDTTTSTDLGTVAVSGGSASVTTSLALGTHVIAAVYTGTGNLLGSSSTLTQTVVKNIGILLLDPTGQSLTVSGNAVLNVTNNGVIAVNSSNAAAASALGNANVTASEIDVTGGLSGSAAFHGAVVTGAAAVSDPLATLAAPPQPAAQFTAVNYSGTLQPGTYVGGITVSGSHAVTLQSGI
jgi:hypothetical protein